MNYRLRSVVSTLQGAYPSAEPCPEHSESAGLEPRARGSPPVNFTNVTWLPFWLRSFSSLRLMSWYGNGLSGGNLDLDRAQGRRDRRRGRLECATLPSTPGTPSSLASRRPGQATLSITSPLLTPGTETGARSRCSTTAPPLRVGRLDTFAGQVSELRVGGQVSELRVGGQVSEPGLSARHRNWELSVRDESLAP
ncbi:MAG: hypothetical protein KatS3mg059_1137 [Thermomicrobiales bacterium]|nr:MAG: hypothetical protein KatS3mg059_1137 [Thermomicrobiales bacterium]